MTGFSTNIEEKTLDNQNFRQVLYTAPHTQLVVMSLRPGEDIGLERHEHGDQFIRVESGQGEAFIDGQRYPLYDGVAVVIPAGSEHNITNTSAGAPLRLYTIYSPPEHADGTIHRTKQDAVHAHHHEHHPAP
jgi:mannose-6-phosphate isomerase-like protein (cupin superfamily)